jgi:cysteine-rich repeat protein
VVDLPGVVDAGDYRLTVSQGKKGNDQDAYDLTIGAVGPAGPQGPAGADGTAADAVATLCEALGYPSNCDLIYALGCGDGNLDPGESCDDGNVVDGDLCSAICTICGDGLVDVDAGEECDDGNLVDYDECSTACALRVCGDGVLAFIPYDINLGGDLEECDDGNTIDGDGCSSICKAETPEGCDQRFDPAKDCDPGFYCTINTDATTECRDECPNGFQLTSNDICIYRNG